MAQNRPTSSHGIQLLPISHLDLKSYIHNLSCSMASVWHKLHPLYWDCKRAMIKKNLNRFVEIWLTRRNEPCCTHGIYYHLSCLKQVICLYWLAINLVFALSMNHWRWATRVPRHGFSIFLSPHKNFRPCRSLILNEVIRNEFSLYPMFCSIDSKNKVQKSNRASILDLKLKCCVHLSA